MTYLKPKSKIILKGFSKKQIKNTIGNPKNIEMLFSQEELKSDFKILNELKIWEEDIELLEGKGHKGTSSVIRLIGSK